MTNYALSKIFWQVLMDCTQMHETIFGSLRTDIVETRARSYEDCIRDNGAPLTNCIGFMYGTKIFMARPGGSNVNRKSCYSGYKRSHCLVYLTVTTPDGLVLNLYGPEVGRRHDMTLYRQSGLDGALREHLLVNGVQYYV